MPDTDKLMKAASMLDGVDYDSDPYHICEETIEWLSSHGH